MESQLLDHQGSPSSWDFKKKLFLSFGHAVWHVEFYQVPRPSNEPELSTLEAWRLNHWTTLEVPGILYLVTSGRMLGVPMNQPEIVRELYM